MILKKNKSKDQESKRGLYFQIGLVVSFGLALVAFEWATEEIEYEQFASMDIAEFDAEIDPRVTLRKEEKKIVPKVPDFVFVPDDTEITDEEIDIDLEFDEQDEIQFVFEEVEEVCEDCEDIPFVKVEDMPLFRNGGLAKFHKYIQSKVRYPEAAIEMGIQGRVDVTFVIDEKGNLTNPTVIRSVAPILDQEVIMALKSAPKWKPGKQAGRSVKVLFSMPITFKLN